MVPRYHLTIEYAGIGFLESNALWPRHVMSEPPEDAVSALNILQAMYSLPSELILSPETNLYLAEASSVRPSSLSCILNIAVDENGNHPLELWITIPCDIGQARAISVVPRQPDWLNRIS